MLGLPVAPVAPEGGVADARRPDRPGLPAPTASRPRAGSAPGPVLLGRTPPASSARMSAIRRSSAAGSDSGERLDLDEELPRPRAGACAASTQVASLSCLDERLPEPRAPTRAKQVGQDIESRRVAMPTRHGVPAEQPARQRLRGSASVNSRRPVCVGSSTARSGRGAPPGRHRSEMGRRSGPVAAAGSTSPASTSTAPSGR